MTGPAISVSNLGKRYRAYGSPWERLKHILLPGSKPFDGREFVALENVTFDVARGCALGVIGPNGAGKSTLLKILSGIVEPSEGEAHLNGKVSSIIELGAGFHPDFTGRENALLNATILGYSPDEANRAYEKIAAFSELGRYLDMPVRTYSSGMFVRLAFAVAISAQPEILLVDEALAVGDAVFAHRCLARIREMKERGVTIVFVSHDTNAIVNVCDRTIFLDRGNLVADGVPREVVHLYLLNVAERLTTYNEAPTVSAPFHEIGAVETPGEKRFGSFEARITAFDLLDAAGNPNGRLPSGPLATFQMTVQFDTKVENPVFGVMIKNRYGVEVFGTNTYLRKMTTGTFEPGDTARASFTVPMLLGSGSYTASFAVHTAEGHFYDYRVDACVLEVVGSGDTIGLAALPPVIEINRVDGDTATAGDDFLDRIYGNAPAKIEMVAGSERHLSGTWYMPEVLDGVPCRWSGATAIAYLRLPEGSAHLVIRAKTEDPEVRQHPSKMECFVNNQSVGSADIRHGQWEELTFPLGSLPTGRVVALRLSSPGWVPANRLPGSQDTRELGVLVASIEAR